MKTKMTLITLVLMLSACSVLEPITDKIAPAVLVYCNESYVSRSLIRDTINAELEGTGNTIHVHCKGDPDNGT